jgi:hypothetical protein
VIEKNIDLAILAKNLNINLKMSDQQRLIVNEDYSIDEFRRTLFDGL